MAAIILIVCLSWAIWTAMDTKYKFTEFADGQLTITRKIGFTQQAVLNGKDIEFIRQLTLEGQQYGFTIKTLSYGEVDIRKKDNFDENTVHDFAQSNNIPIYHYELNYNWNKGNDEKTT